MDEIVKFEDFNFKLAVIQNLMYEQRQLSPRFDLRAFIKSYSERQIDIANEGYEIISEAKQYFEQLEIPTSLMLSIDEIYQDGGNEIYLQLCPFWNGEDDIFNIQSVADIEKLPNLTTITLFYDKDEQILEEFQKRGIIAKWL